MSNRDLAYIKKKGLANRNPRKIYKGNRRAKVAALYAEGMSQRAIAEKLDVSKATVYRDLKWLKSSEHVARAQDVAEAVTSGEIEVVPDMPTNIEEFREQERHNVIQLVADRLTYSEIAERLGISLRTVINHINAYLEEYGDWGGRTLQQWRNEQLIESYELMSQLKKEMYTEAVVLEDHFGDDAKYALTLEQAARIRRDARRDYLRVMEHIARLEQLLVQKTEVDIEHKVAVVKVRNVDIDSFPRQNGSGPRLIEG